jgi:hypothetical protein
MSFFGKGDSEGFKNQQLERIYGKPYMVPTLIEHQRWRIELTEI